MIFVFSDSSLLISYLRLRSWSRSVVELTLGVFSCFRD